MFKYILVIFFLFNSSLLFSKEKESNDGKNKTDSQSHEKPYKTDSDKNHENSSDESNKDREDIYYWINRGWDEGHSPMGS